MAYSPTDQAVMTASDTASEADAMVSSPQPSSVKRRAVLGVIGVVAMAGAGAVASSIVKPTEVESEDVVSFAATSTLKHRTGCENWKSILITEKASSNEAECKTLCGNTQGCNYYNLEAQSCINSGDHHGKAPGTCYIMAKNCKEKANNCWDLWEQSNPTGEAFNISKPRMGCENWKDILLAEFENINEHQCGYECSKNTQCTSFNIQKDHHDSCPGTKKLHACYLFKGACTQKENHCWDLYDMASSTTTAAPGSTTATR